MAILLHSNLGVILLLGLTSPDSIYCIRIAIIFSAPTMQTDFEWEVRHPHTPFYVHLVAGSCAGISQHLFMLPFDNIKTHCQAGQCMSIPQIARKIYRKGGIWNFYSGSTVLAAGCIPAHGLYFSIYEFMMDKLKLNEHLHNSSYLYSVVGFSSMLFHDLILTPTQAVKQRLQLYRSEMYNVKPTDVIRRMIKTEGIKSFYKSFGINYFMNVPFGALIVTINEDLKRRLITTDNSLGSYFAVAGLAGLLAAVPTCPFDVIKTRLNTQNCLNHLCGKQGGGCSTLKRPTSFGSGGQSFHYTSQLLTQRVVRTAGQVNRFIRYHSVLDAARKIYSEAGVLGFFKGLKMRILIQCPSSALSWGTYEMFKGLLHKPLH